MKMLTVFDPAMCCSTGVCGSDVDQVLVNFSADVQWLRTLLYINSRLFLHIK